MPMGVAYYRIIEVLRSPFMTRSSAAIFFLAASYGWQYGYWRAREVCGRNPE